MQACLQKTHHNAWQALGEAASQNSESTKVKTHKNSYSTLCHATAKVHHTAHDAARLPGATPSAQHTHRGNLTPLLAPTL